MASGLAHLQLTCFGPPTARLGGETPPREVLWQKHLGLLIYLALSPEHRRTRSHLVGVFWPEMPEQRARKALNEAVLRLRKRLGTERLRTDGEALLLADDDLDVDAVRFTSAAKRSPEEAAPILSGNFLEGFSVDDAPAFEEWARAEGDRYRAMGTSVLVELGERFLAASRFSEAADAARRALSYGPYAEPAVRVAMRAAALAGDPGSALAVFKSFATRIHNELGERPSPGLAGLAESIRRQQNRSQATPGDSEPPLVGRASVYQEAFETVTRGLARGPCTLIVTATSGMGRTRLVDEVFKRAALDGAIPAIARPLESDQDAPWSTLRLLLRSGLTDAPGMLGARPEALSAIAEVLPELRERFPPRTVTDVADMAAALASFLGAIAEERPVVIAVDDAHWADGNSLAALAAAIRQLRNARVVFVVTAAQGVGDPPRELLHLQADVGRGLPGSTARLDVLDSTDLRTLVSVLAPWCRGEAEADRLTRRVAFETGGNPFFAVTLLTAFARATTFHQDLTQWPPARGTYDVLRPFSIPSLVRMGIVLRVGELPDEAQPILRAASVISDALDLDVIAAVSDSAQADVEKAVPELERRGFVTFDGQRYVFTAPIVREVVRTEALTRGAIRQLQRRAVEALAGRSDLESRALRADLLAHIEGGRDALEAAIAVAREARDARAHRLAKRAFVAAERLSRDLKIDPPDLEELRQTIA